MPIASSKANERFMAMAIAKAREGIAEGQTPFGACIVRDGKVVACEHNVVWATTDITAHAEVHAIRSASSMRVPKNIFDMRAQWMALKHMGHGSVVE